MNQVQFVPGLGIDNLGFARRYRSGIVLVVSFILGVFLFAGEMSEGTGEMSLGRIVFVAAVFVALSTVELAIAPLTVQLLLRELRSRDRINFKVILSEELVRPKPTPASIFTILEYRSKTANSFCDCWLTEWELA
jgi:hypothetical protein